MKVKYSTQVVIRCILQKVLGAGFPKVLPTSGEAQAGRGSDVVVQETPKPFPCRRPFYLIIPTSCFPSIFDHIND